MKTIKYFLQFGIITFMASTILLQSCKKANETDTDSVEVLKNSIAYVYKTDNSDGLAFKTLMEENDCNVKLIEKSAISLNNFKTYNLIVIDQNTDVSGWTGTWTNADTSALQAGGKPMLLMGIGGLQYAAKIGNTTNYLKSASFYDNKFFVADKSSVMYKKPFVISVPASTPAVTLYSANVLSTGLSVHVGEAPLSVSLLGKFGVAPEYYPFTFEKNRYVNFGFSKGVAAMTQDGKNFMVNLVYYLGNFKY